MPQTGANITPGNISPQSGQQGATRVSPASYSNPANAIETRIRAGRPNFLQSQYTAPPQQAVSSNPGIVPSGNLLGHPTIRVVNPKSNTVRNPDKSFQTVRPTRGPGTRPGFKSNTYT